MDMSRDPQKPKRRWAMIVLCAVLAFLLAGTIIVLVASL